MGGRGAPSEASSSGEAPGLSSTSPAVRLKKGPDSTGSHGLEGGGLAWSFWGMNPDNDQSWDSSLRVTRRRKATVTLWKDFPKLFSFIIEKTESHGGQMDRSRSNS